MNEPENSSILQFHIDFSDQISADLQFLFKIPDRGREIVGKLSTVPESGVDRDPLKDKNKFEYLLDHEIDNSLNSSVCA